MLATSRCSFKFFQVLSTSSDFDGYTCDKLTNDSDLKPCRYVFLILWDFIVLKRTGISRKDKLQCLSIPGKVFTRQVSYLSQTVHYMKLHINTKRIQFCFIQQAEDIFMNKWQR